jgi:L-fuconolactonase
MTLTICDSHVHYWDPQRFRLAWLDDLPALNQPFLTEHIPQSGSTGSAAWQIEKIVFVQADVASEQGVEEARWVAALAENDARIQGIVAFAPLERGSAARETLAQLQTIPLIKGVRRLIQSEGDGFCVHPDFIAGVQLLPEYGYSFDICIKHHQLPDVIELVYQCPQVQFVLDHVGKPDIRAGLLDPWRADIARLAQFPNVMCKVSGMVTEADLHRWTAADLQPYVTHVLDVFGIDRVMFGSDAPVLRLATDYETWLATLYGLTDALSDDERLKLFYANAVRFYGI